MTHPSSEAPRWSTALRHWFTPERLLLSSFLALIAGGTVGLMTLPGLYLGEPLSWLDALFTATSAVCVTGLIVVDTATHFTTLGQAYLLLLIQLGGLGILTLTTLIIVTLGRRLSLHHEAATANFADISPDIDVRQLVRNILRFTLLFEACGAVVLFVAWLPRFSVPEAAWHALFQAVSAFCNAGFSTFSASLVGDQRSPFVLVPIMLLIVLGGLGFLTLEELRLRWRSRKSAPSRVSLHSRLALATSAVLLAGGAVAFTLLEWNQALESMSVPTRVLNGLFMSVTARTAGFNTVDYANISTGSGFVTILLMSVGGSPGSTAGGLKTTTAAVIALLAYARLRGRRVASAYYRSIPGETVDRAVGVFVVGFGMVTAAILAFVMFELPPGRDESGAFLTYMFEAVSAFNTVGLSMGGTDDLTSAGKVLTIFLMYVGRVGPLTFAAALALRGERTTREFRYAYEDVIVG